MGFGQRTVFDSLLFVYTNILSGGLFEIIGIALVAALGLFAMTLFLEGYLMGPISLFNRVFFLAVTVCCFWGNKIVNLMGVALMIILITSHVYFAKKALARETLS